MATAEVVAVQTALPTTEEKVVEETNKANSKEIETPTTLDNHQQLAVPEVPQSDEQEKQNPIDDQESKEKIKEQETVPDQTKDNFAVENDEVTSVEETKAALEELELEKKTPLPAGEESSKVAPEPPTEVVEGDKEVEVVEEAVGTQVVEAEQAAPVVAVADVVVVANNVDA